MMKLFYSLLLLLLSVSPVRAMEYINGEPQGGGAAIGSYEDVVGLWTDCGSLFMKGDGTCSAGSIVETDPAFSAWDRSTGITITSSQITDITTYLTYADITALWTDCAAGVLMADGTCVVLGSAATSATTDFELAGAAAAIIASSVTESDTTHCPDGASVFTALAGKQASGSYLTAETDPIIDALFDAYTMLYADTDNTPAALSITANTIPGRLAAGIVAIPVDASGDCAAGSSCFGGHTHSTYEPALGNPATTGFVLSSTDAGVRSWVAAGAGDITGVLGDATGDVPVLYQTFSAFTGSDATPDVSTSSHWKNADTTTITGFDGTPVDGQHLWVRCDYAGVFDITSSSIVASNRTTDYTCVVGEVHEFVYNSTSTKWVAKDLPNEIYGLTFASDGLLGSLSGDWVTRYLNTDHFALSTATWGLKDDGIAVAKMADGDWGDFTINTNSATLDTGVVLSNEIGAIAEQKDWAVLTPADADDTLLFKAQRAITITDIHCIVDPAGTGESIAIEILECDGTGDNCATVDAAITCDNDGAEDDGTLTNGAIDAGDWVQLLLGAPTGTVSALTFSIYYTEDK